MKRTILLLTLLLVVSMPAWADIAMPPGYATVQGNWCIFCVGVEFQGTPNGDVVVLVYRSAWTYGGATEVSFRAAPPMCVGALRTVHNFLDFHSLTYLGCTQQSQIGSRIRRIDAYLWSSQAPKDSLGPFYIAVDACADIVSPENG